MSIFCENANIFRQFFIFFGLTYLTYVPPLAVCYYEEKHFVNKELSMGMVKSAEKGASRCKSYTCKKRLKGGHCNRPMFCTWKWFQMQKVRKDVGGGTL